MIIAKVIRVNGDSVMDIEETTSLLQDCVDKVNPQDLRRLLTAVKKNPGVVKTALKFI